MRRQRRERRTPDLELPGGDLWVDPAPAPSRRGGRARLLATSAAVIAVPVAALALAGALPAADLDGLGATELRTSAPPTSSTLVLGREAVPEPLPLLDPKGVAEVVPTTTTTAPPPTTAPPAPAPEEEAAPAPEPVDEPDPVTVPAPAPAPPPTTAPPPAPRPPAPAGSVSANLDAIAQCESGGNPRAYNPAGYYGAFQFSLGTWWGLGMTGDPRDYTYNQQKYVALALYNQRGYAPWPHCARSLGLL